MPCDGQLWYRGYNVKTLTNNLRPGEFGFEKIAYLLLFGQLPSESELAEFTEVLGKEAKPLINFTGTTILGMLPLLFDAMFGGMAATIMGGLLVASALTLFVLPVAYCAIHKIKG